MAHDAKALTLTQMKEEDKKILEKFEITSIDVTGYPDYLHYELGDAKVVQSWLDLKVVDTSGQRYLTFNGSK